jgi:hypothetical protein
MNNFAEAHQFLAGILRQMEQSSSTQEGSGRRVSQVSRGDKKGKGGSEKPSGIKYKDGRWIPSKEYKKMTPAERKEHKEIVAQKKQEGTAPQRPAKKRKTEVGVVETSDREVSMVHVEPPDAGSDAGDQFGRSAHKKRKGAKAVTINESLNQNMEA